MPTKSDESADQPSEKQYLVTKLPPVKELFETASQFQRSRMPPKEKRSPSFRLRQLIHRSKKP